MDDPYENSPLAVAATSLHELFECLRTAGFSESQALYLVGQTMVTSDEGLNG